MANFETTQLTFPGMPSMDIQPVMLTEVFPVEVMSIEHLATSYTGVEVRYSDGSKETVSKELTKE